MGMHCSGPASGVSRFMLFFLVGRRQSRGLRKVDSLPSRPPAISSRQWRLRYSPPALLFLNSRRSGFKGAGGRLELEAVGLEDCSWMHGHGLCPCSVAGIKRLK